jgi:hypothetical protein
LLEPQWVPPGSRFEWEKFREIAMNTRKSLATATLLGVTLGGLALARAKNAQAQAHQSACYVARPRGNSNPGCECKSFEQCPGGPSELRARVYPNSVDGALIVVHANYGHETGLVRGYTYCTNSPVATSYVQNYTQWISGSSHEVWSCGFTGYSRVGIGCEGIMSSCP